MSIASDREAARADIEGLAERSSALLDRIERATNDEQRNWRPAAGAWSMVEIVQHIALATAGMFRTTHPASTSLRWRGVPKVALMTRVLRSRIKIRAPVSAIVPRPGATWDEARTRLSDAVAKWREFVEGDSFDTTAFRHPLTGRITSAQTARFVAEHFDHHVRQIDRLLTAQGLDQLERQNNA